MNEIPNTVKESFLSGRPFVTTKDTVFDPSDPFCHGAELTSILRSQCPTDVVSLDKEILLHTDGGGNHNIARISTQVSLICLFIQLKLDMFNCLALLSDRKLGESCRTHYVYSKRSTKKRFS